MTVTAAIGFLGGIVMALVAMWWGRRLERRRALDAMERAYRTIQPGIRSVPALLLLVRWQLELEGRIDDAAEREAQRRSFAFGNVHLANPDVTRAMIDDVADARKLDES